MSAYAAVVRARFRVLLQYRAAAFAGFVTQLFWGFIQTQILEAFYRSSGAPQPIRLDQAITYVWLGQATLVLLPWNADNDVKALIRSGAVAYEMLRPIDLYNLWFSRAFAMRTAPTVLRAVPMFLCAIAFFGMSLPPSLPSALGWALATSGALLLSCAITVLINISMLWTVSGDGMSRLLPALVIIGAGLVIPIPLFPAWSQWIFAFLPFRGLMDAPFRVYMGHIQPAGVWAVLAHQAAWTLALVLLGRFILSRGIRRMEVQGG